MIIDFKKALPFFAAYAAHRENDDYPRLQGETAQAFITSARDVAQMFTEENVRAILMPLDSLNAMILDAEVDSDQDLAECLRRDRDRVAVHVARRLVEALNGESTTIARQLAASIKRNEESGVVVPMRGQGA